MSIITASRLFATSFRDMQKVLKYQKLLKFKSISDSNIKKIVSKIRLCKRCIKKYGLGQDKILILLGT